MNISRRLFFKLNKTKATKASLLSSWCFNKNTNTTTTTTTTKINNSKTSLTFVRPLFYVNNSSASSTTSINKKTNLGKSNNPEIPFHFIF